jgi:hypothetical protein
MIVLLDSASREGIEKGKIRDGMEWYIKRRWSLKLHESSRARLEEGITER